MILTERKYFLHRWWKVFECRLKLESMTLYYNLSSSRKSTCPPWNLLSLWIGQKKLPRGQVDGTRCQGLRLGPRFHLYTLHPWDPPNSMYCELCSRHSSDHYYSTSYEFCLRCQWSLLGRTSYLNAVTFSPNRLSETHWMWILYSQYYFLKPTTSVLPHFLESWWLWLSLMVSQWQYYSNTFPDTHFSWPFLK